MSTAERQALIARRDPEVVRANDRARYYRDWEKRRAAADAYQANHPEKHLEGARRWRERNPEKRKAQVAVGNALRDRRLVREPCEVCGAEKVHAHHDDYSRPLEVRWLCRQHHAERHRTINEEARMGTNTEPEPEPTEPEPDEGGDEEPDGEDNEPA